MSATSPLGAAGALGLALLTSFSCSGGSGRRRQPGRFPPSTACAATPPFPSTCTTRPPGTPSRAAAGGPSRRPASTPTSARAASPFSSDHRFPVLVEADRRASEANRLAAALRLASVEADAVVRRLGGLLWAIALAASGYRLRVSAPRAALETLQWLTFTTAGMPNLNHAPTAIIGGAAWSLPYQWWVYCSLPLAGRLMALRPSRVWLILSMVGTAGGVWWISSCGGWLNAAAFLGGIASAFLVRQPHACAVARHPAASIVCLGVLAAVTRFDTAFAPAPLLLLSLAFAIIACGNSLFGALEWRAVRGLGDMGYSIYLLHGLVLFAVFALLLGSELAAGAEHDRALARSRRVRRRRDGGELYHVSPHRSARDAVGGSRQRADGAGRRNAKTRRRQDPRRRASSKTDFFRPSRSSRRAGNRRRGAVRRPRRRPPPGRAPRRG